MTAIPEFNFRGLGLGAAVAGAMAGLAGDRLKVHLVAYFHGLDPDQFRVVVGRLARDLFLTEEALAAGYGGAHRVKELLEWISREIDLPIS